VGEDDDGFLLVKNKRGMSESVLPYICSIGGAKPELRSGGFNRDAQHLYSYLANGRVFPGPCEKLLQCLQLPGLVNDAI